jgi:hypothetical protein
MSWLSLTLNKKTRGNCIQRIIAPVFKGVKMLNRKAEVKKSTPFLIKIVIHWGIALMIGFSMAHYAVIEYGGVWPEFTWIHLIPKLIKEYWIGGIGLTVATTVYEIYRKRR